jgi:hypothetical protein
MSSSASSFFSQDLLEGGGTSLQALHAMSDGQWASCAGLKRAHVMKLRRALNEWAVQVCVKYED